MADPTGLLPWFSVARGVLKRVFRPVTANGPELQDEIEKIEQKIIKGRVTSGDIARLEKLYEEREEFEDDHPVYRRDREIKQSLTIPWAESR